ncbi:MAG TPA: sulfur carrier protein ThiS [Candidatus Hydrogenedentes bacterium]|nr:sulfur carrier protein ThiS [Candidatus Hydrogenedentota bacterium]HOK90190.1 sulfur carrier protein ThiS [Candidatus Hydrogenedentota bacterium]HPO31491.1 sulfur carrier protein ThiS [Candidatus Hydrogenedentota bacterium]
MSDTITIHVNDEPAVLPAGATLNDLPAHFGLNPETVVMLLNGEPVPREAWPERSLADGDAVDLARFVGGG